jgi:hypothetical protein
MVMVVSVIMLVSAGAGVMAAPVSVMAASSSAAHAATSITAAMRIRRFILVLS